MSANLDRLEHVAARLGALKHGVVFLGGAVTELLVTDPGAPVPRMTEDIDAIVEIATRGEYYALAASLRTAGFSEDHSEGAPVCRWLVDRIKVDLMPPDEQILGFSNRWYHDTLAHAVTAVLPRGTTIRLAAAPYFLATKLEAFTGRGHGDFAASHDIEDVLAVVDGRPELREEVRTAPATLRRYLSGRLSQLLVSRAFLEAIPGHLPSDEASQQRLELVLGRLEAIAADPDG